MRILHTADWHLDKRLGSHSRLLEQRYALDEICRLADEHEVDAVLLAGDNFDTFNPSAEARNLFYKTVKKLSKNGSRPVIAIAGNHDSPERTEEPEPLAQECGVFVLGYQDTAVPVCQLDSGVEITKSSPGFVEIKLPSCPYPLRLLLTPYANEVRLRKFLAVTEVGTEMRQHLQKTWQNLADQHCDKNGVNVLAAHLFFTKENEAYSEEPEEERPILVVGGAQAIFSSNVPRQVQYVALGHLHSCHQVDVEPCPIWYAGSPLQYSFSEAGQQKFVCLVDVEPGESAVVQKFPLSSGKQLVRTRFKSVETAVAWLLENPSTLVELTMCTEGFLSAAGQQQLRAVHTGIVNIIPVVTSEDQNESHKNDIDVTRDVDHLFSQFFISKTGQQPNEELIQLFKQVRSHNASTI
jgi:DNA repair protein SbcD/Mre11